MHAHRYMLIFLNTHRHVCAYTHINIDIHELNIQLLGVALRVAVYVKVWLHVCVCMCVYPVECENIEYM